MPPSTGAHNNTTQAMMRSWRKLYMTIFSLLHEGDAHAIIKPFRSSTVRHWLSWPGGISSLDHAELIRMRHGFKKKSMNNQVIVEILVYLHEHQ